MRPVLLNLSPGQLNVWSPDSPHLYQLTCELWIDGTLTDRLERRTGFRQALFRAGEGFFLNGERLYLRGVNRHEDMPGFGRALPAALHELDVDTIKSMGCNFVRLSHYPQSPTFLDACDAKGLLVYPELASWKSVRTGRWLRAAERQFTAMIRRDRHHPSVILWGMGNESRSRVAYQTLSDLVRREDPIRPTIYAENHLYRARREKTIGLPDIWGLNYELDDLPEALQSGALKNVIVSECSNHPHAARGTLDSELEQVLGIATDLSKIESHAGVAGFCLWGYADYATLRKKRYRRFCGIVDAWRVPKLAHTLLQARYRQEPIIRIAGSWSLLDPAPLRTLYVITNGRPDGTVVHATHQPIAHKELRQLAPNCWQLVLPFSPEPIELVVFFGSNPKHTLVTPWGVPARFTVEQKLLSTDAGRHFVQADIRVVDDSERTCYDWEGLVALHVPHNCTVHTCFANNQVSLSGGIGRAYISAPTPLTEPLIRQTL